MNKVFGGKKDKDTKKDGGKARSKSSKEKDEVTIGVTDPSDSHITSSRGFEIIGTDKERDVLFEPGILQVTVVSAKSGDGVWQSPMCLLQHCHIGLTTPAGHGANPEWNYPVVFDLANQDREVTIMVFEHGNTDLLYGNVKILPAWVPEKVFEVTLSLRDDHDNLNGSSIKVKMLFKSGKKKLTPDDFVFMTVLGEGSFGKVMQVRKKDNQQLYAMKILKKQHLIEREEVDHTLAERKILELNRKNIFLVGLKYSFQTDTKLYLLLDYVPGGEVFNHLQNEQYFSEDRSRFYTAQLILGLEFLHERNIMYRDLKPENVLVDFTGYIALTDFGLCKMDMPHNAKTETFCGTPEYMAPEVIRQNGYGREVDWWTIGILLFEMLTGLPPFYDEDVHAMYSKILFNPLSFENVNVKPEAQDLITKLLERDPVRRLGYGEKGYDQIKQHPFFNSINWSDLASKRIKAPWRPELETPEDVGHFDPAFTTRPPIDSHVPDSLLDADQQAAFVGFTYNEKTLG